MQKKISVQTNEPEMGESVQLRNQNIDEIKRGESMITEYVERERE